MILFHILDEAEVAVPVRRHGRVRRARDAAKSCEVDADGFRSDYLEEIETFRNDYRRECFQSGIDYVPLDTSMQFDRALTEYLASRRGRG